MLAVAWVPWCLLMRVVAPTMTVVGYETVGRRHLAQSLLGT